MRNHLLNAAMISGDADHFAGTDPVLRLLRFEVPNFLDRRPIIDGRKAHRRAIESVGLAASAEDDPLIRQAYYVSIRDGERPGAFERGCADLEWGRVCRS